LNQKEKTGSQCTEQTQKDTQQQSQVETKSSKEEKDNLEERLQTIEKSLALCLKSQSQLTQDVSFVAEAVRQIFAVLLGDNYDTIVENYYKELKEEEKQEEETEEKEDKKKKKYKYQ
jgi:hypothetical protein